MGHTMKTIKHPGTPHIAKITIHYCGEGPQYTVTSPDQCRDDAERSAAETALQLGCTITIGAIFAEVHWNI